MKWIDVTEPEPGDLAFHSLGYDPREVTEMMDAFVWLKITGKVVGPCPRENYTFRREVADE